MNKLQIVIKCNLKDFAKSRRNYPWGVAKMQYLLTILEGLPDKRQARKVRHRLVDIVALVLLGTLGNANDWEEIETFGLCHQEYLKQYLALPNGIPGHDTIRRVMALIDPKAMENIKRLWEHILYAEEGERLKRILNIDGKTLCGSGDVNHRALHVVTVWSDEDGISLGQKAIPAKNHEGEAIMELLDDLNCKGQTITIDAMGTQRDIAEKIVGKQGNYVLAVKGNQGNLEKDIQEYFQDDYFRDQIRNSAGYYKTTEKSGGGIVTREYYQTEDMDWLNNKKKWAGITSIGMVKSRVEKRGKTTEQTRYYISSLPLEVEYFAKAVRGHWAVEIMHWQLDVTFREDANKTLDKWAALNLHTIRKFAMTLLKRLDLGKSYSLKTKRFFINGNPAMALDGFLG
jgi:predicted transposase YbfD/YdcC